MSVTPAYKGYVGRMEVDIEAGLIHGEVIGLRDVITFQGETPDEALQAFRESIDDYLSDCAEIGREPEKSYSGKLLIRTQPKIHRALTEIATAQQISVNELVGRVLTRFTERKLTTQRAQTVKESESRAVAADQPGKA